MLRIEQPLLDQLFAYSKQPTLQEAQQCFKIPEIQNAALFVANEIRDFATEVSWRRATVELVQPLNHRWFFVGGAAVGVVPIPRMPGRYNWFATAAWNTMPDRNGPKECSERRMGKRALKARCRCLVGIAVVGDRNDDKRSGIMYPTLEPCEVCRDDMRGQFRSIYRRDTAVLMERPGRQRRVLKTVQKLMSGHGERWP